MKYCTHPDCGKLAQFEYEFPPITIMEMSPLQEEVSSTPVCEKHLYLLPRILEDVIEFRFHRLLEEA